MNTVSPLASYLDKHLIKVHQEISSRKALIESIASLLALSVQQSKKKQIYHSLLEREKLGNTGIGKGVALPHSRFEHAKTPTIAIITLRQAIDYDSLDSIPVNIAFGLLVPTQARDEHLGLLGEIARFLTAEKNRTNITNASNPETIIDGITSWTRQTE